MKITKANNVLIETTNRVNGCLEQGGVAGLVMAYPLAGVILTTGLSRAELEKADANDLAPAYDGVTIAEACERNMAGRVVRRGVRIE
jgi:hypothetical protein